MSAQIKLGQMANRNRAHGANVPRHVLQHPPVKANADLAICCEAICLRVRKVTA
jgi:hypothetical protein